MEQESLCFLWLCGTLEGCVEGEEMPAILKL